MQIKGTHVAIFIIALLVVQYGYPGGITGLANQFTQTKPTPPLNTGGTNPPAAATPYTGPITFSVNTLWAYDESSNAISAARFSVYHKDWSIVQGSGSNLTIASGVGTAATVVQASGDQGTLFLVARYLTSTTYFIDRDLTVNKNKPAAGIAGISGWTLKDVDNNGQDDVVFTVDVSQVPLPIAGQSYPVVGVNVYSWKAMGSGGGLTAITSTTGMTTAGDYHETGYYGSWTAEGYQLRLLKAVVGPYNTTSAASSLYDDFAAGTVNIKGFTFQGYGTDPLGNKVLMGNAWSAVNYDASQNLYIWYQANYNGKTDVTQVSYGMPIIYYRQAGSSFLQYDIWIHCSSGVLVASSWYKITTTLTFTNPAGTTFTESIDTTLTG